MNLKQIALLLLGLCVVGGIGYAINNARQKPVEENENRGLTIQQTERGETGNVPLTLDDFKDLYSAADPTYRGAMERIEQNWRPEYLIMMVEVHRNTVALNRAGEMLALMQRVTGQRISRTDIMNWLPYYWGLDVEPPDFYPEFKIWLYAISDEKFEDYFDDGMEGEIPLDEIIWGGVGQDGIPPLKDPEMIPGSKAFYMGDDNEVFGVVINGDARAYPKRILAHHEMFKATIGGTSVCGVY